MIVVGDGRSRGHSAAEGVGDVGENRDVADEDPARSDDLEGDAVVDELDVPFDDREVAREALRRLGAATP